MDRSKLRPCTEEGKFNIFISLFSVFYALLLQNVFIIYKIVIHTPLFCRHCKANDLSYNSAQIKEKKCDLFLEISIQKEGSRRGC